MSGNFGLAGTNGAPIALKSVHLEGRLDGILADVTITQRYRNESGKNLEIAYTFPLAWGATLLGMDVALGGGRLRTVVAPRPNAEEQYEKALADGYTPVMVEESAPGLYTANLGNIKNGEDVEVAIHYAQLPRIEQGRCRLTVPCVIEPRYGDPYREGGLAPHESADADVFAEYPLTCAFTLSGAAAKARASCPSHAFAVRETENGLVLTVNSGALLDRDVVLLLEEMDERSDALLAPDMDKYMALARFCPALPSHSRPVCMKILVDCSGSMAGNSIRQARMGLKRILRELGPWDRISLSLFGQRVVHEINTMVPCSAAARERLGAVIACLAADMGATEMERALESVCTDIPAAGDAAPFACVLLITDGEIWNVQRVVDTARRSHHRVFAVGVGSAPAESLLRELAEQTDGACELVSPLEDIGAAIARQVRRIRGVRVRECRVDWGVEPEWQSAPPRRIHDGDTVYAFASFAKAPAHPPVLCWSVDGREERLPAESMLHTGPETASHTGLNAVARLGGARRMAEAATREEARELALRHQLVSKDTSLFLVHVREGEKQAGLPELHQVPQMMAAGHGGFGSVAGTHWNDAVAPAARRNDGLGAGPQPLEMPRSVEPRRSEGLGAGPQPHERARAANRLQDLAGDALEIPSFLKRRNEPLYESPEAAAPMPRIFDALSPLGLLRVFQQEAQHAANFEKVVDQLIQPYRLFEVEHAVAAISGKTRLPQKHVWALLLHWLADCFRESCTLAGQTRHLLQRELDAMPDADRTRGFEDIRREFSGTGPDMWRIAASRLRLLQGFEKGILRGDDPETAARGAFKAACQPLLEQALADIAKQAALPMAHVRVLALFLLMERSDDARDMGRHVRRVLREAAGAYPHAAKTAALEALGQMLTGTPPEEPETGTGPAGVDADASGTAPAARGEGVLPMRDRRGWRARLREFVLRQFPE